jgi:hypothetical protein
MNLAVGDTMPESQREFYDDDWLWKGVAFMYSIDQNVMILNRKTTGKVLGAADADVCLENYYLVKIDLPGEGPKAILVHEDNLKLLTCHWCRDTQQVPVTPFTIEQYETNTIPQKPCPECQKEAYIAYMERTNG